MREFLELHKFLLVNREHQLISEIVTKVGTDRIYGLNGALHNYTLKEAAELLPLNGGPWFHYMGICQS